jgi:hypothetical protein
MREKTASNAQMYTAFPPELVLAMQSAFDLDTALKSSSRPTNFDSATFYDISRKKARCEEERFIPVLAVLSL